MSWLSTLVRPNILRLQAYASARSLAQEAQIFLDANEAPGTPGHDLNRYPSPQPAELLARFAKLYGVSPENILLGRGSDEAIDLLTRAFCEPGRDQILTTPPTYGMYKVAADIQDARVVTEPLTFDGKDWRLPVAGLSQRLTDKHIKIVYICSPNNPTGTVFGREELRSVCAAATNALVVVDEAYVEFSPESTCVALLKEFPHLVILRTLSKAWALAGIRCGVALGAPDLIALLQKVRAPYPLPRPVIDLALQALTPQGRIRTETRIARLVTERERMARILADFPQVEQVFPSGTNFLLVRFKNEADVMAATKQVGILVRSRTSEPGLANCVRLTIGHGEENEALLTAIARSASR